MRLIDADALKEEVNKKNVVGRFNTIMLIDNAPTVDYPFYQEAYQTGYEEGKNERPQGEPVIKCKECKYQVKGGVYLLRQYSEVPTGKEE